MLKKKLGFKIELLKPAAPDVGTYTKAVRVGNPDIFYPGMGRWNQMPHYMTGKVGKDATLENGFHGSAPDCNFHAFGIKGRRAI